MISINPPSISQSFCKRSRIGANHGWRYKCTRLVMSCLQFAKFCRWRLRFLMTTILLLFISRPPKQVNHSIPCRLVSLTRVKGPWTEYFHLSRQINSNMFIGRSKNSLNEVSITFPLTNKSFKLVRIGERIDFFAESHSMKHNLCRGASD